MEVRGRVKRVLVVDDSPRIRRALREVLESLGYGVDEASDGQQALTHCMEWSADAILLDIDLPVMDGLSFLRTLRASRGPRQPPVIVCKGENTMARVEEALTVGADGFIAHPLDAKALSATLGRVGLA